MISASRKSSSRRRSVVGSLSRLGPSLQPKPFEESPNDVFVEFVHGTVRPHQPTIELRYQLQMRTGRVGPIAQFFFQHPVALDMFEEGTAADANPANFR
jgi:hypothetical protein